METPARQWHRGADMHGRFGLCAAQNRQRAESGECGARRHTRNLGRVFLRRGRALSLLRTPHQRTLVAGVGLPVHSVHRHTIRVARHDALAMGARCSHTPPHRHRGLPDGALCGKVARQARRHSEACFGTLRRNDALYICVPHHIV